MAQENGELKVNWLPDELANAMAPQAIELARGCKINGLLKDALLVNGSKNDCVLFERMFELSFRRLEAQEDILTHTHTTELGPTVSLVTRVGNVAFMAGVEFHGFSTPESSFRLLLLFKQPGVDESSYIASRTALVHGTNQLMSDIGKPVNIPTIP